MKKLSLITLMFISALFFKANAQGGTDTFKPNGKPIIRVFSNAHSTFTGAVGTTEATNASAFEVTRVYLGYEHHFNQDFTGTVIYDVANPGVGGLQMTAFLKNAFLNYKHKNLSVNFGMMPTTQFKVQEDFWGNRYIEKVFQDKYGFNPSADLGASISYKFSNIVSADLSVENGEGYKKVQTDNKFKTAVGLTINPVKELTIRGIADVMGQGTAQSTYAGFVGYKASKFALAAEYNYQKNNAYISGNDWYGPSFYASVDLSKKSKFFARYDDLQSSTPSGKTTAWNITKDGKLIMLGFDFALAPGIKLSPNFSNWKPADNTKATISMLTLNCDIKF